MVETAGRYGPWGVVAGGSDGIGAAFAHEMCRRGLDVVLVARRQSVLDEKATELRARYGSNVRTVCLDLSAPAAMSSLAEATSDLEVGLFVYNAGSDDTSGVKFLDKDLAGHTAMVRRNCTAVLEAAYLFGAPMVQRRRGALVLVTSRAAWAGGATLAPYCASKGYELLLAEGLWAEWRDCGVDVLAYVLGPTDTPTLNRVLAAKGGGSYGALADPDEVAREGLDHLADGPTWMWGDAPEGVTPFGAMTRREAALAMTEAAAAAED